MATPPNDDTKLMFKLLGDGRWHSYIEIRDAIAAAVPPGRALRKYEDRVASVRRKKGPDYDTDASEAERIFYGARACGQIVLTSWKGRGIEFSGTDENKQVRVRPGFKTWGIEHLPDDPKEPEISPGSTEVPQGDPEPSEAAPQAPEEDEKQRRYDALLGPVQEDEQKDVQGPEEEQASGLTPAEREEAIKAFQGSGNKLTLDELPSSSQSVAMEKLPHCDVCGLWIVDMDKHKAWHIAVSEPEERDDMALFSESDVRRIIEEVISKHLDEFQVGMQGYLGQQFAQVESRMAHLAGLPWRAPKVGSKIVH